MDYTLLVKLLCAHVVADFVLQNKKICAHKLQLNTWKGWCAQIAHALIQAATAYVFVWDWTNWIVPMVIFVSHLVIDVTKSYIGKGENVWHFVFDQLAHFVVIVGLFCGMEPIIELPHVSVSHLMLVAMAYIIVMVPASLFISMFYQQSEMKDQTDGADSKAQSLPRGGEYIGILERVLILTFILVGYPEGIGFLLAAKSIFRFGDLQKSGELKLTEYVLIGTFISFAIAIIVGYGTLKLMKMG